MKSEPDRSVRGWLREGDPANGIDLDEQRAAEIRRLAVREGARHDIRERTNPLSPRSLGWAAASALAIVVAVLLQAPSFDEASTESPTGAEMAARPDRTIHFRTSAGTQVVWVLDPNFDL